MTITAVWEADTLPIRVTVSKADASADFTGATVAALMRSAKTWGVVAADAAVITDSAGEATFTVDIQFDAGALFAGAWSLQVRITSGGVTQTVAEEDVSISDSIEAA